MAEIQTTFTPSYIETDHSFEGGEGAEEWAYGNFYNAVYNSDTNTIRVEYDLYLYALNYSWWCTALYISDGTNEVGFNGNPFKYMNINRDIYGFTGYFDVPAGTGTTCTQTFTLSTLFYWGYNQSSWNAHKVTGTETITFDVPQRTITCTASPEGSGTFTGAGSYKFGSSATITAVPSTGYEFVKWSDGVTTASRTIASVTDNLSFTAEFKLQEFPVTFAANGNGVSGMPDSQTKIYGESLTLTSIVPTRFDNNIPYNFVKWNTQSDGSGTDYAPGATYTGNAALPLYAIWEVAYKKPQIIGMPTIKRCNSSGVETDTDADTYISVTFSYQLDSDFLATPTAYGKLYYLNGSTWTEVSLTTSTWSGASGTNITTRTTNGIFNVDNSYQIKFSLYDNYVSPATATNTTDIQTFISVVYSTLDVYPNGKSIGIGTSAPDNTGSANGIMRIGMDVQMRKGNTFVPFVDMIYPIGSIYMSINDTDPTNLFGGTWERIQDTFLLAAGTTYAAGTTGGEATHTLTVDEMPAHSHDAYARNWTVELGSGTDVAGNAYGEVGSWGVQNTGGGQAHNNMPPYLAVYIWKRTA